MATHYVHVLAVWVRLETTVSKAKLSAGLQRHLEADYSIIKLEIVEDTAPQAIGTRTISLQLQLTFNESEVDDDEPTEDTLDKLNGELRRHLETKYRVSYLEILDDALTSYFLAKHEQPDE